MCNRSGGLIARAIEAEGIPTAVVMMLEELARAMKIPRVLSVRFPFGRPFGEPGNSNQQRVVLEDALRLITSAGQPGTVAQAPYRWRREDYAAIRRQRSTRASAP